MKNKFAEYIKLMYFYVFGNLLLLTSAVCEKGTTRFSRRLVPRMSMVPEMLEALLAAVTVLTVWSFIYYYIQRQKD